uniref:PHB domain-containing protein n=1 Tax=Globodera pallida TaxID=36090 RepID=A0A183BKV8_GLOPA
MCTVYSVTEPVTGNLGFCGFLLSIFSTVLLLITAPFSLFFCVKIVNDNFSFSILSRDAVTVAVDVVVYFRISNATISVTNVEDSSRSTKLLAQTTLRNVLGTKTLAEMLSAKNVICFALKIKQFFIFHFSFSILSRDAVTVAVDVVVYFRISNATISVTNVEDSSRSTKLLAQTTLRNVLGTKTLAEMLSDREHISLKIQETLDEATYPWGVKVERVEIKDVRLPYQLQRAMAAEAEATREARAKVIAAEGEELSSKALSQAAELISQSPSAIHLSFLQTLKAISAEKNQTIVVPIPVEIIRWLNRKKNKKQQGKKYQHHNPGYQYQHHNPRYQYQHYNPRYQYKQASEHHNWNQRYQLHHHTTTTPAAADVKFCYFWPNGIFNSF